MTREEAINEIKSWDFLEGKEIEAIHTLIPELLESEDERIRKKLIEYFSHYKEDREWWEGITPRDIISYLEKQKLRKFKLGDKVHWYDDDTNVITITGFRDDAYLTDSAYGPILFCDEDNWEKEQKPVEESIRTKIISRAKSEKQVVLISETNDNAEIGWDTRSLRDTKNLLEYGLAFINEQLEQKPAEWDELQSEFENIDEAFEDGKKEVVAHPEKYGLCKRSEATINGEPIPTENHSVDIPLAEWSKEDETHRDFILESLEDQIRFCKKDAEGARYAKQIRTAQDWLKDIFLNHKKCIEAVDKLCSNKWSEEDEKIWNHIIDCAESRAWIPFNEISWLVAHKPQSHWKPSEEDERMRKGLINFLRSSFIKENITDETVNPWIAYLERQKPFATIPATEIVKNEPMEMPSGKSLDALADVVQAKDWKPSEHQMNILKAVKDYVGEGSGYWGEGLRSLIDDLEKLM